MSHHTGRRGRLEVEHHVHGPHVEAGIAGAGVISRIDAIGIGLLADPPRAVIALDVAQVVVAEYAVAGVAGGRDRAALLQFGHDAVLLAAGHGQGAGSGGLGRWHFRHLDDVVFENRARRADIGDGQAQHGSFVDVQLSVEGRATQIDHDIGQVLAEGDRPGAIRS